jgi:hydrogenase 3 maturation protease
MIDLKGLEELLERTSPDTLVVCGVGNILRADDAIGPLVVAELGDPYRVLDCGSTPENYVFKIEKMTPSAVLFIDAMDFGGRPGEIRLFEGKEIEGSPLGQPSTHAIPLSETLKILGQVTRAEIHLLGVQPRSITFGHDLSPEVERALNRIVSTFVDRTPAG